MNQKEWYAKLEEWAFDDARLHRMPLAFLPTLAEHLANLQAAEQSVQRTGCTCPLIDDHTMGINPDCVVHGELASR